MTIDKSTARIGKWYRRIGTISVGAVLFLILVGGIVRSTGSGMGCPDWPKCFGLWVPPTEVGQIPDNFFTAHPEYQSQSFNAFQTYTEYVNRLIGALIGLLVFLTAVLSLGYFKRDKRVFLLSTAALLLTGFQGWLGKIVVDKHLAGGMVTAHMFVAIIILMVLITAVYFAYSDKPTFQSATEFPAKVRSLGIIVMVITIGQILIGTQVRENVDEVSSMLNFQERETWLSQLGLFYSVHKVFWAVVTLAAVVWIKNLFAAAGTNRFVKTMGIIVLVSLGAEILIGISLATFGLPAWMQPIHLLIANLMFAAQFALLIYSLRLEKIARPALPYRKLESAGIDS